MKTQFLVVGAGISGLLISKVFQNKNIDFKCVEACENPGGRASTGPHRLYDQHNINYIDSSLGRSFHFEKIEEPAHEYQKGEWKVFQTNDLLAEGENFYLKSPFFEGTLEMVDFIVEVSKELSDNLLLKKTLVRLDLEERKAKFLGGDELTYEKLVWAAPFSQLNKLLKEKCLVKKAATKKDKKESDGNPTRAVLVEFQITKPVFDFKNSFIIPFRYKEFRLHAIGQQYRTALDKQQLGFLVFLNDASFDDSEEIAKAIRAFKREFEREIPRAKDFILQEKIVEFTSLSGEKPIVTESLKISDDVYYIGPELTTEKGGQQMNLDLVVANARNLEHLLTQE